MKAVPIITICTILSSFFLLSVKAQSIRIGIAPEILVPFNNANTVSVAGIIAAEIPVVNNLKFTLATGAVTSIAVNDYKRGISFFPAKAGLQYDITRRLFLVFNSGAALGYSGYGNHFLIGGGAGVHVSDHLDFAVRAEDAGVSYLAVKVEFKF